MRGFRTLWTASTISSLGDGVSVVAGPLLAAALTRDPVQVAGLMVAEQLPFVVFTLPGGAIVDRVDRRFLMAASSVVRVLALGLLGLMIALGQANLPLLYVTFLLVGCAAVLYENASMTAIPALVGPDELERANGRMYASTTLGRSLLAPLVAGWLFTLAPWTPFVLDATAFALVALLALNLPRTLTRVPPGSRPTLRAAIVEGVRWLLRHRLLRTLALTVALENLTLGSVLSILVLIAQDRLGLDSVGYGLLVAAMAVGGIAGGLVAARVIRLLGPGTTLRIGFILEALTHLGLALTRSAILAGVIGAVLGLHLMLFSTLNSSLRQSLTPPDLLGRVHSAYRLLSNGGLLLGAATGGLLAHSFGLTAPFWLGFALVSLVTIAVWRVLNDRDITAARATARST